MWENEQKWVWAESWGSQYLWISKGGGAGREPEEPLKGKEANQRHNSEVREWGKKVWVRRPVGESKELKAEELGGARPDQCPPGLAAGGTGDLGKAKSSPVDRSWGSGENGWGQPTQRSLAMTGRDGEADGEDVGAGLWLKLLVFYWEKRRLLTV